jgi:hypothetical protein
MYKCKECGVPAISTPDGVLRGCKHTGTIVAECEAIVYGVGSLSDQLCSEQSPT